MTYSHLTSTVDELWAAIIATSGYPFNPLTQTKTEYLAVVATGVTGSAKSNLTTSYPELLDSISTALNDETSSIAELLADIANQFAVPPGMAFPDPEAVLDVDFVNQRYWWNGAIRTTANFATYNLNGSTFGVGGLTPSATIDVTVNLTGFFLQPGAFACRLVPSSLPGAARAAFQIDNVTDTNVIRYEQGTVNHLFICIQGGSTTGQISVAPGTVGNSVGAAASFNLNDFRFYLNGTGGTPDVAGNLPGVAGTILRIGKRIAASSNFSGAISRIVLYDNVQNNAWLQAKSNEIKT